jgi:hypothetical protein
MPYKEIWGGVLCIGCSRLIPYRTETAWKKFTRPITQSLLDGASKVDLCCPHPDCFRKWSYPVEQFVRFQVEGVQEAR